MPEKIQKQGTVLYVDDDLLNLQLVRRTLSRIGYAIVEAMDAKSGIEKALSNPPDLILMDLNMPDIDGFEAVRRLRKHDVLQTVPIIILTADHSLANPGLAREAGSNDFLNKPIRYKKLVNIIEKYMATDVENHNALT